MAERAEMSQSYYSEIERGARPLPTLTHQKLMNLADALGWTLSQMQRATGVDLGLVEVEDMGQAATPIFLLQDLLNQEPQPDAYAFIAPNPNVVTPPSAVAVFADSNEMVSEQRRSIHKDDIVFIDTDDTTPDRPNNVYAIQHEGRVHLRRLSILPSGPAFTADNPQFALNFIPIDQARVLGRAFRIVSDHTPLPPTKLN